MIGEGGVNPHGFKEAYFPDTAPIEAYGNGGFRFAEMSHQGSILCLPSGIYRWSASSASDLTLDHFDRVLDNAGIDVFLLGFGADFLPVPKEFRPPFQDQHIVLEGMSTGAAIRTYNVLLSEGRKVGCGLIAVD